jgi:hypothetical protein
MTREQWRRFLRDPQTTVQLDQWLEEDRLERERAIRENNEEIVTRYLRNWFKMTEPKP